MKWFYKYPYQFYCILFWILWVPFSSASLQSNPILKVLIIPARVVDLIFRSWELCCEWEWGVCYCCCFSTEGWWRKEEYFSCCNLGWTINTSEKRTISQRKGGKIQIFRNINLCRIWWSANLLQTKIAYKGLLNQKLRYAKNRFNLKHKLWTTSIADFINEDS